MKSWKHGKMQDVHKQMQPARIPVPHRTHVFLIMEDRLYIQDLAWLHATALELKNWA